jgi:hypothetical protein
MKMFANDTKVWIKLTHKTDTINLKADLDRLMEWSNDWLLRFNGEKCKIMHIGNQ